MKKFIFKIFIEGDGETEKDAWSNALQEFSPGNRDYDECEEICIHCNDELPECGCFDDDSMDILSPSWLNKADEDYERSRDEN